MPLFEKQASDKIHTDLVWPVASCVTGFGHDYASLRCSVVVVLAKTPPPCIGCQSVHAWKTLSMHLQLLVPVDVSDDPCPDMNRRRPITSW